LWAGSRNPFRATQVDGVFDCAQQALNEITGEFTSDDLLGRSLSSFCIGK